MKGFYEKYKKKFSIILALIMAIQIIFSFSPNLVYADSQNTGKDLGNIFSNIKLIVDGSEIGEESLIEFDKDKTVVEIEFKWDIEDEVDIDSGDFAEIILPSQLAFLKDASGDLLGSGESEGTAVGTYTLSNTDKTLLVVFNDSLKGKDEKNGYVSFSITFNLKEFETNTTQIIKFNEPINKEFEITLKPQGNYNAISKLGKPDAEINANNINWEIDVNTMLDTVNNAIIADVIPEGLELNTDSFEIYNLLVGYSGTRTLGTEVKNITPEITADGFRMTLGKISSAYRIKYSTKIKDYSKASYINAAKLSNGDVELGHAEATISKIARGSSIEKSGVPDKSINAGKITWTIDINKSEMEVSSAVVSDTLGSYLKQAESIRIYELNKSGSSWVRGADRTEDLKGINNGKIEFPISLGDINGAYRIIFETEIQYPEVYSQTVKFENSAAIEGSNIERGEVKADVTVTRDTLLEKGGVPIVNYYTKEIKWTLHVNKANHNITNAVISDSFGAGHELKPDSLKVFGVDGKEVKVDENGFPKIEENSDKKSFRIQLGDIDSYYRVEYITEITDYDQVNYINEAILQGEGVPGNTIVSPGKIVNINNSYTKSNASGTFGGVSYDGINYDAKTMSWKITIRPLKGKIIQLKITDTYPNKGMLFLPETLRVLKGSTLLVEDMDYSIAFLDGESHKGFIIEFASAIPLEGSDYNIYYKTSFDPDKVKEAGGEINSTKVYINKAEFAGKMEYNGEKDITGESSSSYTIIDNSYNSGMKEGSLRRDAREIDWKVYVNYMSRKLDSFVAQDTMSDGQEFDESTLAIKGYSVSANGNITENNEVLEKGKDYTVEKTEKGFKLTFINGINKPYIIKYTSKITGISKSKYTNTAVFTGGGTYTSTVGYSDYDKFLVKEAVNVEGTRVYTDDIINWRVTLNQSLSQIENAVFTDTISKGLEYVNDSLMVYKVEGAAKELVDKVQYTFENKLLENGDRELRVKFNNKIERAYTIEYDTVVIAANGTVKNNAVFNGDMIETVPSKTKEYTATQVSSGGGSGISRGKIEVVKVDGEDNETKLDAEFELYYLLNGEERIIGDDKKATTGGILEYTNLPLRTYYLREVKAPEGYQLNTNPIQITLNSSVKLVRETVVNYKLGRISIKKVDDKDNGKLLKGAEFKLTNLETGAENILTTDVNGEAGIDSLPHGKYKLKEIKAPEGYLLDNTERTIIIDNDNNVEELTLTNRIRPIIPPTQENYGSITLKKVDSTDETRVLEGAVFEIKDINGKVEAIITTNRDGIAKADKLAFGEYSIAEIKAPAEYKLAGNPIKVSINSNEAFVEIKITNEKEKPTEPVEPDKPTIPTEPDKPMVPVGPDKPKPEEETDEIDSKIPFGDVDTLPKTGEGSKFGFYMTGFLLASLGVVLRKKKF